MVVVTVLVLVAGPGVEGAVAILGSLIMIPVRVDEEDVEVAAVVVLVVLVVFLVTAPVMRFLVTLAMVDFLMVVGAILVRELVGIGTR